MLAGDNGILQRATTANENTDSSQIQERINLAYQSSLVGGQGKVTDTSLESELKKEFNKDTLDEGWLDKTSVEGKWKITIDGISLEVPAGEASIHENHPVFFIDGKEYQFEPEMTWEDWVLSKYSKDEYEVSNNAGTSSFISIKGRSWFVTNNDSSSYSGRFERSWWKIQENYAYTTNGYYI